MPSIKKSSGSKCTSDRSLEYDDSEAGSGMDGPEPSVYCRPPVRIGVVGNGVGAGAALESNPL